MMGQARAFLLWAVAWGLLGAVLGAAWARPRATSAPAAAPAVILSPQAQVAARNLPTATRRPLPHGAPSGAVLDQVQVKLEPLPEIAHRPIDLTMSLVDGPQGPRAVVEADGAIVAESTHLAGPRLAPRLPSWDAGVLWDGKSPMATVGHAWGPVGLRVVAFKGGAALGIGIRW